MESGVRAAFTALCLRADVLAAADLALQLAVVGEGSSGASSADQQRQQQQQERQLLLPPQQQQTFAAAAQRLHDALSSIAARLYGLAKDAGDASTSTAFERCRRDSRHPISACYPWTGSSRAATTFDGALSAIERSISRLELPSFAYWYQPPRKPAELPASAAASPGSTPQLAATPVAATPAVGRQHETCPVVLPLNVPNEAGVAVVGQGDDVTPTATTASSAAPDSTPTTPAAVYSSGMPDVGAELQQTASIATVADSDRGSTPQVRPHGSRSEVPWPAHAVLAVPMDGHQYAGPQELVRAMLAAEKETNITRQRVLAEIKSRGYGTASRMTVFRWLRSVKNEVDEIPQSWTAGGRPAFMTPEGLIEDMRKGGEAWTDDNVRRSLTAGKQALRSKRGLPPSPEDGVCNVKVYK